MANKARCPETTLHEGQRVWCRKGSGHPSAQHWALVDGKDIVWVVVILEPGEVKKS